MLAQGFSLKKAADVVCFEAGDDCSEAVAFNSRLSSLSEGLIPPLCKLRYLAVGGNHTNTFLRACKAGCATPVHALQDQTGKLNAAALSAKQPAGFAKSIQSGLAWLVIDKRLDPSPPNSINCVL